MSHVYTISAHALNELGVLSRVALLFTRRRILMQRLRMTAEENVVRFDIVVRCDSGTAEKVIRQLRRVVEMLEVSVSEGDRVAVAPTVAGFSPALLKVG